MDEEVDVFERVFQGIEDAENAERPDDAYLRNS